jgi:hypothetical protein
MGSLFDGEYGLYLNRASCGTLWADFVMSHLLLLLAIGEKKKKLCLCNVWF